MDLHRPNGCGFFSRRRGSARCHPYAPRRSSGSQGAYRHSSLFYRSVGFRCYLLFYPSEEPPVETHCGIYAGVRCPVSCLLGFTRRACILACDSGCVSAISPRASISQESGMTAGEGHFQPVAGPALRYRVSRRYRVHQSSLLSRHLHESAASQLFAARPCCDVVVAICCGGICSNVYAEVRLGDHSDWEFGELNAVVTGSSTSSDC